MGLDATVMCRCYAQGRTASPPHQQHVVLDPAGYLALDLPWKGHVAEHEAFDAWQRSACEHPKMEAATERIANWGGFRLFQEALGDVGWEHFPTLKAVLPNRNGGRVDAVDSAHCIAELVEFENRYSAEVSALIDSETNEPLHHYIRSYEGVFIWDGRAQVDVGIDDGGLFVRRRAPVNEEVFRALRVEQRLLDVDGNPGAHFVDLDHGARVTLPLTIHGAAVPWPDGRMQDDRGKRNFSFPARMHVAKRRRDATSFAYVLEPLRRVLHASVETGNPVRWC